jgi:hypothetical protein
MANIDNSFNRNRLIGLYLKENGLSTLLSIEDFDTHFEFDNPLRLDILPTSKNTKIYVTAKITSEYFGRKTMRYNRIHITDIPTITVNKTTENTLYSLLPVINEQYGLFINDEDIEDIDISGVPAGQYSPTLTIKPTSLIFYSGTKIITT